jgi:drug/metabolite transporter (DMT)-like permease
VAGGVVDRRAIGLVIAVGLLDVGGLIAFAVGLHDSSTWLVGLSSSFGPVVVVTAGVLLLGERPRPVQWLGLGLVAASVFLIALG